MTSQSFDLSGYTAADKPTLYFNYALDDADANALGGGMQDSFRVYASSDGVNWTELVTNNSVPSNTFQANAELPTFPSVNGGAYEGDKSNQQVQEAFDPTGNPPTGSLLVDPNTTAVGWRQARVDLGDFAGKSNVTLRFDFSTAGSMGIGSIDQGGVYLGALPGNQLQDGQSYILDNTTNPKNPDGSPMTNPDGSPIFTTLNYTFTFRQGYVLQAPVGGGPNVKSGETFTVNVGCEYGHVRNQAGHGRGPARSRSPTACLHGRRPRTRSRSGRRTAQAARPGTRQATFEMVPFNSGGSNPSTGTVAGRRQLCGRLPGRGQLERCGHGYRGRGQRRGGQRDHFRHNASRFRRSRSTGRGRQGHAEPVAFDRDPNAADFGR